MYSEKEIKIALREYIASNGGTPIDEKGIIDILDQGADRDFYNASRTVKAARAKYGVKSRIPEWLRMLAFRLVYDCMASDAGNNSEMAWYGLLGYEKKAEELLSSIGLDHHAQNRLLSVKGDRLKMKEALLELALGKEQGKIMAGLKKKKVSNGVREKLKKIGVAQTIQDRLLGVRGGNARIREKQIEEILAGSVLGDRPKEVFDILMLQAKTQENLLKALGFNKKVFDGTSWQMYSPDMKLRQGRFNPVKFPFTYAEAESNPIYAAMLHYLISEARMPTDTFIDVFGKMGYVPAFCADGYTHKLLYTDNREDFLKYFHGITDRPTKTYEALLKYIEKIQAALKEKLDAGGRDKKMKSIVSDASLMRGLYSPDLSEYAVAKFCDMCFRKPYWEDRNLEENEGGIDNFDYMGYRGGKFIKDDYSSVKRARQFISISKEDFLSYAAALKKIECGTNSGDMRSELYDGWLDIAERRNALLYVDVPKRREYARFSYSVRECGKLMEILAGYEGEWILAWKEYGYAYPGGRQHEKNLLNQLKKSRRPLFEFKYNTPDHNIRNGIRFITNINFDGITLEEFESRYGMGLWQGEGFGKKRLN